MVGRLVKSSYFLGFRGIVVGKVELKTPKKFVLDEQISFKFPRLRWKILWYESPFSKEGYVEVLPSKDFQVIK